MKKIHNPEGVPQPIGPYSISNIFENLIFLSGQLPVENGELIKGDIKKETELIIKNIKTILETAGSSLDCVLKTTVFLKNMDDFGDMNEIYGKYFKNNPPARSAIQVAKLPKDSDIEIELIAYKK
ncbi:endoribonuclease [Tepiditoga spiralis]|uniref:Endoribonuclease n=1 Tax=Tepiditoga spiralis TaxID=2108365 RepID=A0A7G1G4V7_9BACT|nr:Rid family detoxifying hydrolase [Tepiditoga spiralis]BBE31580.1 endoribonuclease [Tepiditoga spiralis]